MTDSITTFAMDLLVNDEPLHLLTDKRYMSELPRADVNLNGQHKTVVGMTVLSTVTPSYFQSLYKGYERTEATLQIVVLTAYGTNDHHCRAVVNEVKRIFENAAYIGSYRIFTESVSEDVKPDASIGKWTGTLNIKLIRFDPYGS